MLNKEWIEVGANTYLFYISPIMNGGTARVGFEDKTRSRSIVLDLESGEVLLNLKFTGPEVMQCQDWLDENRMNLWKKTQKTPVPSKEEIRNLQDRAAIDFAHADEYTQLAYIKALEDDLKRRIKLDEQGL